MHSKYDQGQDRRRHSDDHHIDNGAPMGAPEPPRRPFGDYEEDEDDSVEPSDEIFRREGPP
jgi:hypothetical protein